MYFDITIRFCSSDIDKIYIFVPMAVMRVAG